jgi:hypothetical protein
MLQRKGSRASSGVMMVLTMAPPPRRHTLVADKGVFEHIFIDTQQDYTEGGGVVAAEEQAKEAFEIPTILCYEDASRFRAQGFCF